MHHYIIIKFSFLISDKKFQIKKSRFAYNKIKMKNIINPFTHSLSKIFKSGDLGSMQEIIIKHAQMLNVQQGKYVKTACPRTLQIAHQILAHNSFLKTNVLGCPGVSTSQVASLKVILCDINKHPTIKAQYQEWAEKGRGRVVAIGGPSAYDQTLISALIGQIRSNHDIHFYTRNYLETNVWHSANQSHARHGNALNADPVLSGRHLLPLIFKRMLFSTSVQNCTKHDYIKVDVKLSNFKYVIEYCKNELNGIKQIVKTFLGQKNEHDINRLESLVSQQIQKVMQKSSGLVFTSNHGKQNKQSMAIHLIFSSESLKEIRAQQSQFSRVEQLKWEELPASEIKTLFPQSENILTAFRYHGDYSNVFNMYELQKEKAKSLGAVWEQNKTLKKVYIDKDKQGKPFACGVEFQDGKFIPADKIHLTLGYKGECVYEGTNVKAENSLNIPATGVSTTFIMKNTPQIKKIIQEKGSLQLAIINSHWTIIAYDDQHVLMRATAGGNTGTQTYMPSHFLNLCTNTRNIFGNAFIGIVSVYGCVRAVNYKNSTQFAKLANGLVVSYGKGGTGNTKRASQAYKALKYLGFSGELKQFFGSFQQQRLNIVDNIEEICKKSEENNFYYDNTKKTIKNLFL